VGRVFATARRVSLAMCFFPKRIFTLKVIRQAFVLVFLNVKIQRVIGTSATLHAEES
jgi:hypothetical protein